MEAYSGANDRSDEVEEEIVSSNDNDLDEEESEEGEEEVNSSSDESEAAEEEDAEASSGHIDEKIELLLNSPKNPSLSLCFDLSHIPTSLHCSPKDNIAGVATVKGDVTILKFEECSIECLARVECFACNSCQDLDFSICGYTIFTVSSEHEVVLVDVNSQQMYNFGFLKNSDKKMNVSRIKCINHSLFSTADEKGYVRIWDSRNIKPHKAAACLRQASDGTNEYISDMVTHEDGQRFATASCAGLVTVFDIRKLDIINQNSESNSDLNSLVSICNGREVVAGSLKGDLVFTSWQNKENKSHVFNAVRNIPCNSVTALTENLIIASWDDNFIRLFAVYPHKFLGYIGQKSFPAEYLDISSQKQHLLTCGFDQKLWLWNIQGLERKARKLFSTTNQNLLEDNFFSDL